MKQPSLVSVHIQGRPCTSMSQTSEPSRLKSGSSGQRPKTTGQYSSKVGMGSEIQTILLVVVLGGRLLRPKTQNYTEYSSKEWRGAKYKQLCCWWWSWWAGCSSQRPKTTPNTTPNTRLKSEGERNTNNFVVDGGLGEQAVPAKDPKLH